MFKYLTLSWVLCSCSMVVWCIVRKWSVLTKTEMGLESIVPDSKFNVLATILKPHARCILFLFNLNTLSYFSKWNFSGSRQNTKIICSALQSCRTFVLLSHKVFLIPSLNHNGKSINVNSSLNIVWWLRSEILESVT